MSTNAKIKAAVKATEEAAELIQNTSRVLLSTRDVISGYKVVEELGVVAGSSVQARSFFHDLWSRVRGFMGGEAVFYSQLMTHASADAARRLMKEAEKKGANAVVRLRYENSSTSDPTAGVFVYSMAYGTAVKVVALDGRKELLKEDVSADV
eukprot:TRINITY_DN13497_c0_g1_i1.p1 TRINITY_DN13497_c0_g1~~TRINITY_DN13497_c0_g1_i1.p1  ORF type:complete len:161 (+),score=26.36 TRINITY_DN13497_c0_g1_i1:29-484(+)